MTYQNPFLRYMVQLNFAGYSVDVVNRKSTAPDALPRLRVKPTAKPIRRLPLS